MSLQFVGIVTNVSPITQDANNIPRPPQSALTISINGSNSGTVGDPAVQSITINTDMPLKYTVGQSLTFTVDS